jgi:hypothetical protein
MILNEQREWRERRRRGPFYDTIKFLKELNKSVNNSMRLESDSRYLPLK